MSSSTSTEQAWRDVSLLRRRLQIIKRFRHLLCTRSESVLAKLRTLRPESSPAELLSSELIPLLDAAKFLEDETPRILAPRSLGRRGQPVWLWGVESAIHREALGRILILAPSNYPLFLPMVQALHAWAAGNSVLMKSAPGSFELHSHMKEFFLEAGGPDECFELLGEDVTAYQSNLERADKVVLVGSAETGKSVLSSAGQALRPAIAELSGWDLFLVHPEANMEKAAQALAFGLALNRGQTCVAPRRVFIRGDVSAFEEAFQASMAQRASSALSEDELSLVKELQGKGVRCLSAAENRGPVLLSRVAKDHPLLREERFGAISCLVAIESDEEALELANLCPFALGATIFGPEGWAQDLAHKLPAQMVSINDCIVPTADPRVPFGGSGKSGFGRMRGAEGLLEMTKTRTVSVRRGGSLDHFLPPGPLDEVILEKFMKVGHSPTLASKVLALISVITAIARERIRKRRQKR